MSELLKLNAADVSAKFAATVEKDRNVVVPGIYTGKLSGITLPAAEQVIKEGGAGVLALKEGVQPELLLLDTTS